MYRDGYRGVRAANEPRKTALCAMRGGRFGRMSAGGLTA